MHIFSHIVDAEFSYFLFHPCGFCTDHCGCWEDLYVYNNVENVLYCLFQSHHACGSVPCMAYGLQG